MMSVRTILIVVLALVCGGSAALGVNLYARFGGPKPDTVPVVTAARDIPRGTAISPDQIKIQNCSKDLVPAGSIASVEDAVGRVVITQLVKDEPILDRKLGAKNARGGLASLVPPSMRAFTILTPNISSGVAGFVLPGNKVDVLLTLNGNEKTGGGVTTTLLQNVEILAVDARLDAPNENKVDPKSLQSVTLLVTPDQAAKLNLGQDRGTLHLSLRNPEDDKAASARPATLNDLQFHQEKPWPEHVKDWIEAYARVKDQHKEETDKNSPDPQAEPPPLEIRTLRGKVNGLVQVEPVQQVAGKR